MKATGIFIMVGAVVLALGFLPGSIGSGNAGDQPLILAQRGAPVIPQVTVPPSDDMKKRATTAAPPPAPPPRLTVPPPVAPKAVSAPAAPAPAPRVSAPTPAAPKAVSAPAAAQAPKPAGGRSLIPEQDRTSVTTGTKSIIPVPLPKPAPPAAGKTAVTNPGDTRSVIPVPIPRPSPHNAMAPPPPVRIRALGLSDTKVAVGELVAFTARIQNPRSDSASRMRVRFFAGNEPVGREQIINLPAGGSQSVSGVFTPSSGGTQRVRVEVEPLDGGPKVSQSRSLTVAGPVRAEPTRGSLIPEQDKSSVTTGTKSVIPVPLPRPAPGAAAPPPVRIRALGLSDSKVAAGEKVMVSARIQNPRSDSFSQVRVRFYSGRHQVGEDHLVRLAPGATDTVTAAVLPDTPGRHRLRVQVTPLGEDSGGRSYNLSRTVTVTAPVKAEAQATTAGQAAATSAGSSAARGGRPATGNERIPFQKPEVLARGSTMPGGVQDPTKSVGGVNDPFDDSHNKQGKLVPNPNSPLQNVPSLPGKGDRGGGGGIGGDSGIDDSLHGKDPFSGQGTINIPTKHGPFGDEGPGTPPTGGGGTTPRNWEYGMVLGGGGSAATGGTPPPPESNPGKGNPANQQSGGEQKPAPAPNPQQGVGGSPGGGPPTPGQEAGALVYNQLAGDSNTQAVSIGYDKQGGATVMRTDKQGNLRVVEYTADGHYYTDWIGQGGRPADPGAGGGGGEGGRMSGSQSPLSIQDQMALAKEYARTHPESKHDDMAGQPKIKVIGGPSSDPDHETADTPQKRMIPGGPPATTRGDYRIATPHDGYGSMTAQSAASREEASAAGTSGPTSQVHFSPASGPSKGSSMTMASGKAAANLLKVTSVSGKVQRLSQSGGKRTWAPLKAGDSLENNSIIRVEKGANANLGVDPTSSAQQQWTKIGGGKNYALFRLELKP